MGRELGRIPSRDACMERNIHELQCFGKMRLQIGGLEGAYLPIFTAGSPLCINFILFISGSCAKTNVFRVIQTFTLEYDGDHGATECYYDNSIEIIISR